MIKKLDVIGFIVHVSVTCTNIIMFKIYEEDYYLLLVYILAEILIRSVWSLRLLVLYSRNQHGRLYVN